MPQPAIPATTPAYAVFAIGDEEGLQWERIAAYDVEGRALYAGGDGALHVAREQPTFVELTTGTSYGGPSEAFGFAPPAAGFCAPSN